MDQRSRLSSVKTKQYMSYKTLERKTAQTLTIGKDGLETFEGLLLTARVHIGRNDSALYTFRTKDGVKKVWGNRSIDEALLDETHSRVVAEAFNKMVKIEVTGYTPVGEEGKLIPECSVSVDADAKLNVVKGKITKK